MLSVTPRRNRPGPLPYQRLIKPATTIFGPFLDIFDFSWNLLVWKRAYFSEKTRKTAKIRGRPYAPPSPDPQKPPFLAISGSGVGLAAQVNGHIPPIEGYAESSAPKIEMMKKIKMDTRIDIDQRRTSWMYKYSLSEQTGRSGVTNMMLAVPIGT